MREMTRKFKFVIGSGAKFNRTVMIYYIKTIATDSQIVKFLICGSKLVLQIVFFRGKLKNLIVAFRVGYQKSSFAFPKILKLQVTVKIGCAKIDIW